MANQNKKLKDDLGPEVKFDQLLGENEADNGRLNTSDSDEQNKEKEYFNSDVQSQAKEETISLSKSKIILAKKLLNNIKENNERLIQLLAGGLNSEEENAISISQLGDSGFETPAADAMGDSRTIEGVFDGESMIGPDGKQYSVPANYASKSKLVEGDILKLSITQNGTFIYKQIGPIERARVVGALERSAMGEYFALADGKKWRLLSASATYFKGEPGDEVVILVPKNGESKWAAVENIVRTQQ